MEENKNQILKEFRTIPSIGKACALDLWNIGLRSADDLKWKDPAKLYAELNRVTGAVHDICMLYTFRCAVYYVSTEPEKRDPELLKWWNWKERKFNEE